MAAFQDLRPRIITAALLIGSLLVLLALAAWSPWGRVLLSVVGSILVMLAGYEYAVFSRNGAGYQPIRQLQSVRTVHRTMLCAVGALTVASGALAGHHEMVGVGGCAAALVCALGMFVAGRESLTTVREYIESACVALVHVGIGGAFLASTPLAEDGALRVLVLVAVVAVNDTAAYFGGSRLRGPKFCVALSPNKTVSGSVCGFLGGALVMTAVHYLAQRQVSLGYDLMCALALVAAAQAGDLAKSYLKRLHGVKDTGTLLPGHGGVLDRIDGFLAGAPIITLWWVP